MSALQAFAAFLGALGLAWMIRTAIDAARRSAAMRRARREAQDEMAMWYSRQGQRRRS